MGVLCLVSLKHSGKGRPDMEEMCFPESPRKDFSLGLIKFVTVIVIFMAGIVLGLLLSSTFTRYYPSRIDVIIPTIFAASNCGKGCSDFRNFVTPKYLMHRMTDEQLFWRASMVQSKPYPYNRMPKVAFMFLTRGPLLLAPLWERFFQGHEKYFSVYVHTNPDYYLNVSRTSPFYRRQIPSEEVEWGTISLVEAEKRLLANALLDFNNERFVLLSESCIPVFNFPTVYNYLLNSEQSYIEMYDEDSGKGRGRYNRHMAPDILLSHWRKGSEWFEMNRELARIIVSDLKYFSLFRKYCRPSCFSDEHYIPTFINMFYGSLNANRTLTWVDWSKGGPHPVSFGKEDITASFISRIRNNGTNCSYNNKPTSKCHLFARKFTPSALEPLLDIASAVMKY